MKKLVFAILFSVMGCSLVLAQTAVPAPKASATSVAPTVDQNVPSREQILKLMELTKVRDQVNMVLRGMQTQFEQSFAQSFKDRMPGAPPEMIAELSKAVSDLFDQIPADELVQMLVPVYQKHLTSDEVRGMIEFYSSPVGKSVLQKMPAMMQEAMELSASSTREKMAGIEQKLDARVQEIIKKHCPKESCEEWLVAPGESVGPAPKAPESTPAKAAGAPSSK